MAETKSKSRSDHLAELRCGICDGDNVIGVASSAFVPMSDAYCKQCAEKPAESLATFGYLYDFVSTNGEGLQDEVLSYFTFKDGKYISWSEYVAWRATQPICDIHKTHQDGDKCWLCDYEKACSNG